MTDRDNIELPPLPDGLWGGERAIRDLRDYGRKCYETGLAAARAEQAQDAKPKVHRAVVELSREGFAWTDAPPDAEWIVATATLCWADDGRAWIESEKNRELAKRLRYYASTLQPEGFRWHDFADAADALDGGER